MSEFEAKLQKWRDQGSLRYLAHMLGVTHKQVTRYWDNGWIDGRYRTAKGHRRIRYTEQTVERAAFVRQWKREGNIRVRYSMGEIDYLGTVISLDGCNTMDDLSRRARRAGLNEQHARNVAYPLTLTDPPSLEDFAWDALLAARGILQEDWAKSVRRFTELPLGYLCDAANTEQFRARAEKVLQGIEENYQSSEEWRVLHGKPRNPEREKTVEMLRVLLSQPDFPSFLAHWEKETELHHRHEEDDGAAYANLLRLTPEEAKAMKLDVAAIRLKQQQQSPSVTALARLLGISRPALYRAYGTKAIQGALKSVRSDARAIHEDSEAAVRKRKKRNLPSDDQAL